MDRITTGISALYEFGFISYSPSKETVEMLFGTNTTSYASLSISLQGKDTFELGAFKHNDKFYYCPERLYIELNKFDMENTIKAEAIRNLEASIDPSLVKTIYKKLIKKRRGLDKEMIETFLNKNLLLIKDNIKDSSDRKTIIREYIMALVSRKEIPLSIIKGGSSVELYTNINRTTLDIDAHASIKSIKEIIKFLEDKNRDVYFKLDSSDDKTNKALEVIDSGEDVKKVFKLKLIPVSKGGVLKKELEGITMDISFNTNYCKEDLDQMIKDYKISKRPLKHLKNASSLVFTQEMLLAEKFSQ